MSARWETLGTATSVSSCAVCAWPSQQSTTSSRLEVNSGLPVECHALSRLANVSQQLSPGAQTIVDERTQERPDYRVDEGDHERFSHYVPKDKLTEAMVMGTPVVALCGKVWVPSRDPERFPVCPGMQGDLGVPRAGRRQELTCQNPVEL